MLFQFKKKRSSIKTFQLLKQTTTFTSVFVQYDGQEFPGEVTTTVRLDFQVIVMHKSGNAFLGWPSREDKIFYQRENIIKKLEPPEVAGTGGQFQFGPLWKVYNETVNCWSNFKPSLWFCLSSFPHKFLQTYVRHRNFVRPSQFDKL